MDVLAPDVVLITDGGGVKKAALRPIHGVEKVLRFLDGGDARRRLATSAEPVMVNGAPALRLLLDGELDTIATDARSTAAWSPSLYLVRNPDKLGPRSTARRSPLGRADAARRATSTGELTDRGAPRGAESAEQPQTLRTCSG